MTGPGVPDERLDNDENPETRYPDYDEPAGVPEREGLRAICIEMISRPAAAAGLTRLEDIALALDEADSMMDWGGSEMQDDLRRWSEALNRVINGV